MKIALERLYGTAGDIENLAFKGRTDRDIVATLMTGAGLSQAEIDAKYDSLDPTIGQIMRENLASGKFNMEACPGAHDIINALIARDDAMLGLLTGNSGEIALLKIEGVGFNPDHFKVKVYGDISPDRADLPPVAVKQAEALNGNKFTGKEIVIIGDTVSDVTCGRGVGAKSIAVLTGWDTPEDIRAAGPDYLFDDLSDTQQVLEAIFE